MIKSIIYRIYFTSTLVLAVSMAFTQGDLTLEEVLVGLNTNYGADSEFYQAFDVVLYENQEVLVHYEGAIGKGEWGTYSRVGQMESAKNGEWLVNVYHSNRIVRAFKGNDRREDQQSENANPDIESLLTELENDFESLYVKDGTIIVNLSSKDSFYPSSQVYIDLASYTFKGYKFISDPDVNGVVNTVVIKYDEFTSSVDKESIITVSRVLNSESTVKLNSAYSMFKLEIY